MNSVNLTGRLACDVVKVGKDTEKLMIRGAIALRTYSKDKAVAYVDFIATGKTAETFINFTQKGSLVGITGHLVVSSYVDKNGQSQYNTKVAVDELSLLDKAPEKAEENKE